MRLPRWCVAVCGVWLLVVTAGGLALSKYSQTPGDSGQTPQQWPPDSDLNYGPDRPTLVFFAHPHCPCTQASMGELNRLLAKVGTNISVSVAFIQPGGMPKDWTAGALWKTASSIPGVTVVEDEDGREAKRFGAESSGHVVLYDAQGQLLFSGGITSARGHAGDNPGESAIVALLNGSTGEMDHTPVFGCGLKDSPSAATTNQ